MGRASLDAILARGDCRVRLLVRRSPKNERLLRPYLRRPDVTVVWGDLLDPRAVAEALGDASLAIHLGGMVSPMADRFPEKTLKVNVEGTANVVAACRSASREPALVYIGSVAQTSLRDEPFHWGRCGDPVIAAEFDFYGLSKIKAERLVAESGLRRWASLRQSGILHPGLFTRGSDPITFHVPLRGVLEWTTVEDSGRLMAALCGPDVPDAFWRGFYNIGSGAPYRLTNYEFERLILAAVGSPPPEKIFEPGWFALTNFHGCWFADGDRLEELVPFRANEPVEAYFRRMVKAAPWWARLAPLAPAPLVKAMMRRVALTPQYGTLYWLRHDGFDDRIRAFFGSQERQAAIPGWNDFDLSRPSDEPLLLNHGYDDSKPDEAITMADCVSAAAFRGGRCLGSATPVLNLDEPLEWQCCRGHRFAATPRVVLRGGHWCPECLPAPWRYRDEAPLNPFLAQLFPPS